MNKPRRKNGESLDDYNIRATEILHQHGYHFSEIAKKLKVDKLTVYNILVQSPACKITTEDERSIMIELRGLGLSYRKIAENVGRSPSCVWDRVQKPAKLYDGYQETKLKDKDIDQLVEWYQQGKTITYIAGQLGISESCVRYRLKAAGILVNRKPLKVTDAEKRKFCKLYKNGKSVKEIAKICKRNPSTIRKYLRESKKDAL